MVTRTPGLAGGSGKPTGSNPGRAPRSDPTTLAMPAAAFLTIAAAAEHARTPAPSGQILFAERATGIEPA